MNPASPTAPLEESLHIKTLLNYLPVIVLSVILLIAFVSWDVMVNNWAVFTTLLIVCLFAGFVNFLNPYRFLTAKANGALLFPPSPAGAPAMGAIGIIITTILLVGGIGLGFGSLGASQLASSYDPSQALMGIGGTLLVIMIFLSIAGFVKGFGDRNWWVDNMAIGGDVYDLVNNRFSTIGIWGGIIACIVMGIPMVVRGKEIADKTANPEIGNDDKNKIRQDLATSGANTMLSVGVILQIIGLAVVGYFIWQNYNTNVKTSKIAVGLIIAVLWILGPIFVSKSQRGPGFGSDNTAEIGSFENKPFLVHGIVYLILGFGFLLLLLGLLSVKQTGFYKGALGLLLVAFLVFTITSIVYVINETKTPEKNNLKNPDDPYYQQLKAEVTKDLQKKAPAGAAPVTDDEIATEMERRLNEKIQTPNHAVMGVFYALSIIITVMILMFYNVRLKMADCGYIPHEFGLMDAFKYVFAGECDPSASKTDLEAEYKPKVKEDKMLSSDWDAILSKNDTGTPFNETFVRFAKWFSLIPFLSILLIVMWVSILFTNITTDPRTSAWIAGTFTGDMFPRVKELLDTFFIVLIVGLLLCGILLLPFVKELNVGGLDSILRFAESIQVWQYTTKKSEIHGGERTFWSIFGFAAIFFIVLSPWWKYLTQDRKSEQPIVPENWGWFIGFVVLWATASLPAWYHGGFPLFFVGSEVEPEFKKEGVLTRFIRLFFTTIYLVPWLIVTLFKAVLYGIGSLSGVDSIKQKFSEEIEKLKFANWDSNTTDLRMFPLDDKLITPASVTSVKSAGPAAVAAAAPPATSEPVGIDETKVSAIGKLIKVILLTISFVILILAVIYYVYKIDATNRLGGAEQDIADGGFVAQMNSPTAHTIYVIMAIVAIAGFVAYLRDKFKSANAEKSPEDYLFNDVKPEDINSPMRQLTFGMTHIIYIVLMIIVWVYDRDVDDKNRMSVTGMTVLGIAILFFHYGLEFIDNRLPKEQGAAANAQPKMAPISKLLGNIRFIMNTVFFIVLCALAYYKQHGVMVALIVFMFLFHLTKSILGLKLLKFLWACIIYIPCLFLDLVQGSQSAVGDTTRPIWIIVAIELLLIAILYGGPYLINYIGASASQIVAAPVSLKELYDTNLTTQSKEIFIYHNTGTDRTPEDKAANCPAEEKMRYEYSISGWFILNNNITTKNTDLEIFNFGNVPRLTYNPSKNELRILCNTLDISGNKSISSYEVYNSRKNYKAFIGGGTDDANTKFKLKTLIDDEELDADIPLQRWNYFVINYNGKTMDFFLNNKLVNKSDFIMPDIQLAPITVGAKTGLNGSICNFAFHKYPLTKEQIRWTYNMLKSQNPPMIGMPTIKEEVKTAGSTAIYSR
jgi:hypothetical protein